MLDTAGRRVSTIDHAGPAPFGDPIGVAVDSAHRLWVVDIGTAQYVVFGADGRFQAAYPRPVSGYAAPWPGHFDAAGRLVDVGFIRGSRGMQVVALRVSRPEGARSEVDTLAVPDNMGRPQFVNATASARTTAVVPFTGERHWRLTPDGGMWIGDSEGYRLTRLSPAGDTILVASRIGAARVPVMPSEKIAAERALDWFARGGGYVDTARMPAMKPYFSGFMVDPGGNLWVHRSRSGAPRTSGDDVVGRGDVFDVFDPGGRLLGPVRLPVAVADTPYPQFVGTTLYALALASATGRSELLKISVARTAQSGAVRARGAGGAGAMVLNGDSLTHAPVAQR